VGVAAAVVVVVVLVVVVVAEVEALGACWDDDAGPAMRAAGVRVWVWAARWWGVGKYGE
jgi:hypothetical protein